MDASVEAPDAVLSPVDAMLPGRVLSVGEVTVAGACGDTWDGSEGAAVGAICGAEIVAVCEGGVSAPFELVGMCRATSVAVKA